jgi:hypothetical protein
MSCGKAGPHAETHIGFIVARGQNPAVSGILQSCLSPYMHVT